MNHSSVGVLGGSFNPIHIGHIELAVKAHKQFLLPKVLIMPTSQTYYKDTTVLADSDKRMEMVRLSIRDTGCDFVKASSIDIDRGGITYTCNTIDELSGLYNEIYFIIGSDSLMYIDKWKDADLFLKKCVILYAKRDTDDTSAITKQVSYLQNEMGADVRRLDIKMYPISSSDIRKKVRYGESISGLVTESVEDYIRENNLYK